MTYQTKIEALMREVAELPDDAQTELLSLGAVVQPLDPPFHQ